MRSDTESNFAQMLMRLRDDRGKVLVNSGTVKDRDEECFLIDADFFIDHKTEVPHVLELIDHLNRESGRFFHWCITDRLRDALIAPPYHPFETSIQFPGLVLFMETRSPSGDIDHWVSPKIPSTTGGIDMHVDFAYRLLCFSMLTQLPREALQEAAESLGRMWQHYRTPFVPLASLPSPSTQVVELGHTYVRPTFYVEEED